MLYKGKVIPFENAAPLKAAQEKNSKLLLKNKAGDFKKEFLALFGDGDCLYLRDKRGGSFIITKNGSRVFDMDNCVILEAQSNEAIVRYYIEDKYEVYQKSHSITGEGAGIPVQHNTLPQTVCRIPANAC